MKIRKTKSIVPLVLGLVGGILGIITGLCGEICADWFKAFDERNILLEIASCMLLFASVLGLVAGCIARRVKIGSLLLLISGVFALICAILLWVGSTGFIGIAIVPMILFTVGGILGMLDPADD